MNPNPDNLPATTGNTSSVSSLNRTQKFRPPLQPQIMARQLCLLVLDASGSMKGAHLGGHTKAFAVKEAAEGLIKRIKISSKRAGFHVGIINFDTRVVIRQQPMPAVDMDPMKTVLEIDDLGTTTNIGKALQEAYSIAETFLRKEQPGGSQHSAVILLMSDGLCCYPDETYAIAQRIKEDYPAKKLKIATALFQGFANEQDQQTKAAIELLKKIASLDPAMMPCFLHTTSSEALRKFFIASSVNE